MKEVFHSGEKKKPTKHLNCNLLSGSGLLSITFHRDLLSSYRKYCNCRDYKKLSIYKNLPYKVGGLFFCC